MRSLLLALALGVAAGVLDVAPMALRRMSGRSIASAFVECLVVALVAVYARTPLPAWAAGLAAGLLCASPIVILVAKDEPAAAAPMLAAQAVLGSLCGLAAAALGIAASS